MEDDFRKGFIFHNYLKRGRKLPTVIGTAVILAGGLGTRLRPLTETIPKPLLLLRGKPILLHIIENAKRYGVRTFLLSIGYRAQQVVDYFGDGSSLGVQIQYAVEKEPLGTGGSIKGAAAKFKEPFFLLWGDNLTDINLREMHQAYQEHQEGVTMALTPREDVEHFGVAALEGNNIITFIEKPRREEAPSNLINAGAFIITPDCLEMLPEGKSSIEKDCFEKLAPLRKIQAYIHDGQWFPTDTLEKYYHAAAFYNLPINFKEKKYIIADVDETICHSCQQITIPMTEQISRLIDKGFQFAFISGTKADDLLEMISSRLQKEHHLLATTGTKYVRVTAQGIKQALYTHFLQDEEKKEIMAACKKLINHFSLASMTTDDDQLQDRESQITFSALGRHAPSEHKASFDPNGEKRKEWIKFLKKEIGEEKYDLKIGGTTSIDITRKGLNKEWGILEFAQFNQILPQQILFFGDKLYPGGNDHPATRIVDCIAVVNPEDTLEKLRQLEASIFTKV